jgi:hypothetical protein
MPRVSIVTRQRADGGGDLSLSGMLRVSSDELSQLTLKLSLIIVFESAVNDIAKDHQ